ncbi:MAG: hypothetical protein LBC18_07920 [Opitutaceae bacterium]|jgi:hypothetical protein|nr:hypothetical protein [Opitutaceae bacterium]
MKETKLKMEPLRVLGKRGKTTPRPAPPAHATIETGFFDLEAFHGPQHFLDATTCRHFFNFARSNRSRSNQTPLQLPAKNAPQLHPSLLLLPPFLPDAFQGQYLSRPPAGAFGALAGPASVPSVPPGVSGKWEKWEV